MKASLLILALPAGRDFTRGTNEGSEAMQVVGSICKIGGDRVAVVMVQPDVLEFGSEADRYIDALSPAFEGLPVVLFAKTAEGKAKYYGRSDYCDKLAEVPPDRIPWQQVDVDL
jgi:hypothetical protein